MRNAQLGRLKGVKLLLMAHNRVHDIDCRGENALFYALKGPAADVRNGIIKILIVYGSNVNLQNEMGVL